MHVGPAGRVGMEVVFAHTWRIVGGSEHVTGGQLGGEMVARLIVHMKIVLVECLQIRETFQQR